MSKDEESVVEENGSEEDGTGEVLAAVGIDPDDGEYEHKETRQKILKILAETEDKTWDLAVILETAYADGLYRSWGFKSWRDYVENELQIKMRKAQYLVQLQEWFKKMPPNIQQWVRDLGWTKARMLIHVVTVENAAEWRNKVAGKTVAEIEKMLKDSKGTEGSDGGGGDGGGASGDDDEKPRNMNFKLFPAQYANVELALEKAKELANSDKPGHALDLICIDFLSNNAAVDTVQEVLAKMERGLGVRIVAYDEENDSVAYGKDLIEELERIDDADEDDDEENVYEEETEE